MATATWTPPTDKPLLFTTSWCPYCARLKAGLDGRGVEYLELDVETDEQADAAAEFVKSVNGGNRVVPTVLFPDGTTATNPPAGDVVAHLA
jgi:mycoredoxin